MTLPFFYIENGVAENGFMTLGEDTSRHIVQVLRMQPGEQLQLTDGKGNILTVEIAEADKKKCVVKVQGTKYKAQGARSITIGISLLKNTSRFEWFLEKATEIGIHTIIPLICERTEKQHFRFDRMHNILVSAMLQSQQSWLPELRQPMQVTDVMALPGNAQKFIAHCMEDAKTFLTDAIHASTYPQIILVGPEGDFTKAEIEHALLNHFIPVTLGETRLRTETAGIVAAALLANP